MKIPLLSTEFDTWTGRVVRGLRRRRAAERLHLLTYHQIAPESDVFTEGTGLRHTPADLEQHLDYLLEHYQPVRLSDWLDAADRGETLRHAVVLTFDDGFAGVLRHAWPVLYRRRVPMTVFPVTGVIGNTDLLWTHKLAWLQAHGHADRMIEALQAEGFPPRGDTETLDDYARRCYRVDLPGIIEAVLRSTGQSGPRLAAALRPYLEPAEIAEADPEFVEFGNHTHTHPVLAALSRDQQREEIATAGDALTALAGRAPTVLAYPFGLKRHYNADSRELARESGHRAAVDMRRRINLAATSPFELSRRPAPHGLREDFEKMMEDWPANVDGPNIGW